MKAKQWVEKLENVSGEEQTKVLMEFFAETGELVVQRTKGSNFLTLGSARDGALREQQSKFRAICEKITWLKPTMFDELLAKFLPEVATQQSKYVHAIKTGEKQALPSAEPKVEFEVRDRNIKKNSLGGPGRKLAAQATK